MRRGTLTTFSPSMQRLRSPCLSSSATAASGGFLSSSCSARKSAVHVDAGQSLLHPSFSVDRATALQQKRWCSTFAEVVEEEPEGGNSAAGTSQIDEPEPEAPKIPVEPNVSAPVKAAIDEVFGLALQGGGAIPLGRILLKGSKATVNTIGGTALGVRKWCEQYPTKLEIFTPGNGGTYVLAVRPEVAEVGNTMADYHYMNIMNTIQGQMMYEEQQKQAAFEAQAAANQAAWEAKQQSVAIKVEAVPKFVFKHGRLILKKEFDLKNERSNFNPNSLETEEQAVAAGKSLSTSDMTPLSTAFVEDPDARNLIAIIQKMMMGPRGLKWDQIHYMHDSLYRSEASKEQCNSAQFMAWVRKTESHFWCGPHGLFAIKMEGQEEAPVMTREDYEQAFKAKKKKSKTEKSAQSIAPPFPKDADIQKMQILSKPKNPGGGPGVGTHGSIAGTAALTMPADQATETLPPLPYRDHGGWGHAKATPTSEDVYEILKFVPVEWGNMAGLNIPKEIKRRCMRLASVVEWFRRQPQYFELRIAAGTMEIRRSVVLHPDAHGLTKEEAKEIVEKQLNDLQEQQEKLLQTGFSVGTPPASSTTALAEAKSTSPSTVLNNNLKWRNGQPHVQTLENWTKLVLRVIPSYYIPIEQVVRRAPKKGVYIGIDLIDTCRNSPTHFDVLTLSNGLQLVRRKTGVDSATWRPKCEADLERAISENQIDTVIDLMSRSCILWDRTHFLYVRLTDDEKIACGDFNGMVNLLKSYPALFRVGEYYYRRVDHSDPTKDESDIEPVGKGALPPKHRLSNENPYHGERELAEVLNYLTPEGQSIPLSYYLECSSPAMRYVLPPRLVVLLQQFPEWFKCVEKSPGSYMIEKVPVAQQQVTANGGAGADSSLAPGEDEEEPLTPEEEEEIGEIISPIVAAEEGGNIDLLVLNGKLSEEVRNAIESSYPDLGTFLTTKLASKFAVEDGRVFLTQE